MQLTSVTWDYDPAAEITPEVRTAHLDYLHDLVAAGHLVAAGPRADAAGGVLLFSAASDEVPALLEADPFSAIALITATTTVPWTVAVGAVSAAPATS